MKRQIKKIEDCEKLFVIQRKLSKVPELDRLLRSIVRESVKLIDGEKGLCLVVDEKDKNLIAYYLDTNCHLKKREKNKRDPIEQIARNCIAIKTGEPFICGNTENVENFIFDKFFEYKMISCLVVPIKRSNKTMGAISITSSAKDRFSNTHLRLMTVLSDFVADFIRNSFLFKRERILSGLKQSLIKALTLTELVEQVNQAFEANGCSIFQKENDKLILIATTGILDYTGSQEIVYSVGEGLTGWIARKGKPLRIYDTKDRKEVIGKTQGLKRKVPKYSEILAEDAEPEAYLGVPLRFRGKVTGVVRLSRLLVGRGFTAADESILSTLASFIAIKIENMRLLEEAKKESDLRRRMFRHAPIGIACINKEGVIFEVNKAQKTIMGGDATGNNILEIESVPNDLKKLIKGSLTRGTPFEWGRREFLSLFGKKSFLRIRGESLFNNGDEVETLLLLVEDESRKASLENQLLKVAKITITQQIIGGVLHSFNSPIASIKQSTSNVIDILKNLIEFDKRLESFELKEADKRFYLSLISKVLDNSFKESHTFDEERKNRKYLYEKLIINKVTDASRISRILAKVSIKKELNKIMNLLKSKDRNRILYSIENLWEIGRNLKNCQLSVKHLITRANSLKEFSTLDQSRIENVDIHDSLEHVLKFFQNSINDKIKIKRSYYPEILLVNSQIGVLNMVWENIIENALEAVKEGGEIRIKTQMKNRNVIVEIENNGPEIPTEIQDNIFDIFFTTKDSNRLWSGYGLYFCKVVVESIGGEVGFKSNKNRTKFYVKLLGGDN